ncbi:hypothetical protein BDL97_05G018800 [Sphagnum fallax]|nr:hypothetical protein BDL97_05G018800 [Sphagnum fallax]
MLHKCFPQLCYCCYLNDSMSLFLVLSDSAATFGLQSWKKQQASCSCIFHFFRTLVHVLLLTHSACETQNKTKQNKSGSNKEKKTQQHSVAVHCSRMLASLFRIHGSRLKCICNPPPRRSGERRW